MLDPAINETCQSLLKEVLMEAKTFILTEFPWSSDGDWNKPLKETGFNQTLPFYITCSLNGILQASGIIKMDAFLSEGSSFKNSANEW